MSAADRVPFGLLLRRFRLAAGRTQAGLAEQSGLSERAINDLERDPRRVPRLESVRLLADALGLSPQDRAALLAAARPEAASIPSQSADLSPRETIHPPRHKLPVQLTPLLGREHEVATVTALLRQDAVRLVTLTGPGGIGKTRLALAVAAGLEDAFAQGIWFVDLSRLTDAARVLPTIAQTLGVWVAGGQSAGEALRAYLRDTRMLLLLDNFEQVAAAAAEMAMLLQHSPGLKVLATSRAVLRVRGEQAFPVSPLGLPPPTTTEEIASPEHVSHYAAVALFIQRAQDARPDFRITHDTGPAVVAICARLDGLPLAIELAAARVNLLSPPALLQRLAPQLPLLTGGPRDLPERQRTMRTTLAWSYDLLTDEEQRLFRRLAVFVGGCTLEAAEQVCVSAQWVEPLTLDLLEGLEALIEKSLVRREENAQAEPRLGMLQVVREYAQEQLEACGEAGPLRRAHAYNYLRLAEQAELELRGPEQWVWLEQLEREHDNLRAALGWLRARAEGELALRLAGALAWFWLMRGHLQEGLTWLEELLVQSPDPGTPKASRAESREDPDATRVTALRAHALFGAAWLHFALDGVDLARSRLEESIALWRQAADERGLGRAQALLGGVTLAFGNHVAARALAEEALARCRGVGDDWGVAWALEYLGHAAVESGDYTAAERWLTESVAGFQALGDMRGMTVSLSFLARVAYMQRCFNIARTRAEQSLSVWRSLGSSWHEIRILGLLGEIARAEGDHTQARAMAEETLRISQVLGGIPAFSWTLRNLGYVDLAQGNPAAAISRLGEALGLFHRRGERLGVACCVAGLAGASAAIGRYERAARLLGAAQALLDALGMRLAPADSLAYEHTLAATCTALGDVAFNQAFAAGLAFAEAEAIALALDQRAPG